MNSEILGNYVLPTMKQLYQRIPQLTAAVLCTADGFNICSFGLDEKQVGKLAALSGSLLSVGNATMTEVQQGLGEPMDLLTLRAGTFQILGLKVRNSPDGHLVMMVAAKETTLGLMIVGAQYVAGEIEKLFRRGV